MRRPAASRALLALLLAVVAAPAAGQGSVGLLRWRGSVGEETVLEIRGDSVRRRDPGGFAGAGNAGDHGDEVQVSEPLPDEACAVYARLIEGRALVSVDQQPDRGNRYTAAVVVQNERRAPTDVELEVIWLCGDQRSGRRWRGRGHGEGRGYGGRDEPPPPPAPPRWRSGGRSPSGRPLDSLHWKGTVDGADYIDLRDDQVSLRHLEHLPVQSMTYDLTAPLPHRRLELDLIKIEGRGRVRLAAEPSEANNWTASILVDDREERGAAVYELVLEWERPRDVVVSEGGRPLERLAWRGVVDGQSVLVIRGRQVTIEHRSGRPARGEEAAFSAPLPERPTTVNLRKVGGRGRAVILEQPSAANGHTLRVLIDDPKSGDDAYRLELTWEK